MNFLEMKKEAAQIIGFLQNNSIDGLNSDQKDLIGKNINREIRSLMDTHPPFGQASWEMKLEAEQDLATSTGNTVTGTKNIPQLVDSNATLDKSNIFEIVSNGTYHHRIIDISGTTMVLDSALNASSTTDTWTSRKVDYPLPPNCGDIEKICYEDGERDIALANSRSEFTQITDRENTSSMPLYGCIEFFENIWSEYKTTSSATATNGSRKLSVGNSNIDKYSLYDTLQIDTGVTDNYIHRIIGIDTGSNEIYMDRPYRGGASTVTLYSNPNSYTEYISFYGYPTTEETIKIYGWIKPHDMVADTDECILPEDLCPMAIIGSLLRDKWYATLISKEWVQYYHKAKRTFSSKKKAVLPRRAPQGWHNHSHYRASDFTYPD